MEQVKALPFDQALSLRAAMMPLGDFEKLTSQDKSLCLSAINRHEFSISFDEYYVAILENGSGRELVRLSKQPLLSQRLYEFFREV